MRKIITAAALAALAAGLTGCSAASLAAADKRPATAHVDAAGCWSGSFGGTTVDGCGPADVPVDGKGLAPVAVVQSKAATGSVHVQLVSADGKLLDEQTTTAAYGVLTVSPH